MSTPASTLSACLTPAAANRSQPTASQTAHLARLEAMKETRRMWRRWLAGVLGAFNALNGVIMLADGRHWYDTVPGVVFTGPYNPHFVQDIGAAFLAAGLGLIARA